MSKLVIILFSIVFGLIALKINFILHPPVVPILEEPWWGHGDPTEDNPAIRPFKINIPDDFLKDLKTRLENSRPFVPPLEDSNQNYGMNTNLLKEILTFWKTKYDWREREKILNKYSHFKTQIQGLDIHFLHVKPENPNGLKVLPLLVLHGWPSSFREFLYLIPMLITPQKGKNFVFEVIIPAEPGFGFSEGTSKQGLSSVHMAVIFKNLMERLGFKKYYIQGGDWGSAIAHKMSVLFEDKILGMHSTFCMSRTTKSRLKHFIGSLYPPAIVNKKFEHRLYPLSDYFANYLLELGYMHIQATKPDTIGVGLNDSPIGLAAYMLEKITIWTNPEWKNKPDGGLKLKYKYEDLLDNVMIYWFTNSITTSMRIYAEDMNKKQYPFSIELENIPVKVPTACARFANELVYYPDNLLKDKFMNLIHTKDFDDGGHFPAFEVPKLLADDIWEAIEKMENFYVKN